MSYGCFNHCAVKGSLRRITPAFFKGLCKYLSYESGKNQAQSW